MLIALVYVLRRSQDLRTPYQAFRERGWRTPYIQRLFRLGLPIGVQMGVEAGAWAFAILLVTPLGVDALAVHQILVTLTLLGYLVYYGLGAATTILVGHAPQHGGQETGKADRRYSSRSSRGHSPSSHARSTRPETPGRVYLQ